jgi:hypothetical protein
MKAILVRVGVDQAYGGWNAPSDPESQRFVYVPIPEKAGTPFQPGLERPYAELLPTLRGFSEQHELLHEHCGFPHDLSNATMHLDPDFEHLTYGDNGDRRGVEIKDLGSGDLVVFYAGLQSIRESRRLIYALVGLYVVEDIVMAVDIPADLWKSNAHTRKLKIGSPDIVVRAKEGVSGRLTNFIPIGEWRNRAYRVQSELLKKWGDLNVKDGFIQRSVRPPSFLAPEKFYSWFLSQNPELIARNN